MSFVKRVGEVALAGALLAAWMGAVEALLVSLLRNVPETALFLRQAILGYGALGLAVGIGWGIFGEVVAPRRRPWHRRAFYLASLTVLVLLFQLLVHVHVHWSDFQLKPGSPASLKVTGLAALPALVVIAATWWVCARWKRPDQPRRVAGRRMAVAALVPLLVGAALPWVGPAFKSPARSDMPNVLMIVLDTTRADRLSPYGYQRPTTPALQRNAGEGLTFTRAYSAAPWTLPAHASIFTGHYPTSHNASWEHQFLDGRLPTLAEHLAAKGLRTAAFSRQVWLSDETGLMRGFEHHYDLYWRSTTALVAAWRLAVNMLEARRGVEDKGAALVSETFMGWIDRHGDEPFFAFINYVEPHAPYKPLSPHREEFLGSDRDTPWGRGRDVAVQRYNAGEVEYTAVELGLISDLYDGAVAYQDRWMGEVLEHLRGRGILDETLLIVTADHGENLGDHGFFGHEFCVYNTLLHVPLIVRLPGVVPQGAVEDATVENRLLWPMIDMVLAAASVEAIPVERFVSALQEEDEAGGPILSELFQRPLTSKIWQRSARRSRLERRLRCVQLRGMKYIWASDGVDELYNLASDPGELDNLLLRRAEDASILRELLQLKVAAVGAPEAGEAPEFSDELKRRLRSLGYLD